MARTKKKAICKWCKIQFEFIPKTKKGFYCSSKCCAQHKREPIVKKRLRDFLAGKPIKRSHIYPILIERDGNRCSVCHITDWNGKPIRFWVDHIDGNSKNSSPNNFRLICLNCDSQTETFGSKNIGQGRRKLGVKRWI